MSIAGLFRSAGRLGTTAVVACLSRLPHGPTCHTHGPVRRQEFNCELTVDFLRMAPPNPPYVRMRWGRGDKAFLTTAPHVCRPSEVCSAR